MSEQPAEYERTTTVSMGQLLTIQAGLLKVSNYAVGVRGGWVDPTDEAKWDALIPSFQTADGLIRALMRATQTEAE